MYSPLIHNRIEHIGIIIEKIKALDEEYDMMSDSSDVDEDMYEEERTALVDQLDEAGAECILILEAYFQDCEDENIPVYLDYYRVYKALSESLNIEE